MKKLKLKKNGPLLSLVLIALLVVGMLSLLIISKRGPMEPGEENPSEFLQEK